MAKQADLLPDLVAHADWGSHPRKRWMVLASLTGDGRYLVQTPQPAGDPSTLLAGLRQAAGERGLAFLGFDFPIGLPLCYARQCGITDFLEFLPRFGQGDWVDFYRVAETPQQISPHRPFYPQRPGNARHAHLLQGLEMESIKGLRRQCELDYPGRRAAAPLFWTLGGQQVGKAAISGWRDVLAPALRETLDSLAVWPFSGSLFDLFQSGRTVIAETYPAEFYRHLGVAFGSHRKGTKSGKRAQADRATNASLLLEWAKRAGVELSSPLLARIRDGFGPSPDAEDPFDATIGLFGMLNVVLGLQTACTPADAFINRIEGWILGQSCADRQTESRAL